MSSAPDETPARASTTRRIVRGLVFLLLLAVVVRSWLAPTPGVFDEAPGGLDEAIARARGEGKPVVAVATSDFCLACQLYKRGTLADGAVQEWIREHAVASFTRIEWETADAELLERSNGPVPATLLLSDGRVVATLEGAPSPDELLHWLENEGGEVTGARDGDGIDAQDAVKGSR